MCYNVGRPLPCFWRGSFYFFFNLLEAQILNYYRFWDWFSQSFRVIFCLIPFSWKLYFNMKGIDMIMLRGKTTTTKTKPKKPKTNQLKTTKGEKNPNKPQHTSLIHFNCNLLRSLGSSVFLRFCNHKVPSFSNRQMSLWIHWMLWFSSPTFALRNLFTV